jgi:hypothetical protein
MTEIQNRCTPWTGVSGEGVPGRQNWFGVFADEADAARYQTPIQGTPYTVHFIHELAELQEPGLAGVVFDAGLRGWKRDVLVSMVATGIPVMIGPRAKSVQRLIWEMKPGVEAAGGIFEIATDDSDFKQRLAAVVRAASLRCLKREAFSQAYHAFRASIPFAAEEAWTPASAQGFVLWCETMRARTEKSPAEPSLTTLPGVKAATHDLRHAASGRLDGELIRECFGLKRTELAKLLGVTAEALRQTPDSPKHQETFALFERIAALRALLADPADFAKWLQSPNAELENLKPGDLVRAGRGAVVADLVQDILTNRGR